MRMHYTSRRKYQNNYESLLHSRCIKFTTESPLPSDLEQLAIAATACQVLQTAELYSARSGEVLRLIIGCAALVDGFQGC